MINVKDLSNMDYVYHSEQDEPLDLTRNGDEERHTVPLLARKDVEVLVKLDLKKIGNLVNIPEGLKNICARAMTFDMENQRLSNTDTESETSKYITPLTTDTDEGGKIQDNSNFYINSHDLTPIDFTVNEQPEAEITNIIFIDDDDDQNTKINKKEVETQTDLNLNEEDLQILQLIKSNDMTYQKLEDFCQRSREDINNNSNELNDYHDEQNEDVPIEDPESDSDTLPIPEDQLLPLINQSNNNKAMLKKAFDCFMKKATYRPGLKVSENEVIAQEKEEKEIKNMDIKRTTNSEAGVVAKDPPPVKPPAEAAKAKASNPLQAVRKVAASRQSYNNYMKWIKKGQVVTKKMQMPTQFQKQGTSGQLMPHTENGGDNIYTLTQPETQARAVQNTMPYVNCTPQMQQMPRFIPPRPVSHPVSNVMPNRFPQPGVRQNAVSAENPAYPVSDTTWYAIHETGHSSYNQNQVFPQFNNSQNPRVFNNSQGPRGFGAMHPASVFNHVQNPRGFNNADPRFNNHQMIEQQRFMGMENQRAVWSNQMAHHPNLSWGQTIPGSHNA